MSHSLVLVLFLVLILIWIFNCRDLQANSLPILQKQVILILKLNTFILSKKLCLLLIHIQWKLLNVIMVNVIIQLM